MAAEPSTVTELARALRAGAVTATAALEACLSQIAARDAHLNAFVTVLAADARAQAAEADREIAAGRARGPLHGVPVSLKDLIDMRGVATTAASRVRSKHVARDDAPVTARLREAGAVIVGKTNLHEFAFGTTGEDSAYGPARHPLDPSLVAGGSSGGSAISVATGMAFASVGTDTGGSIRIPSALCGLVGLKPTLGEIPTGGVVPLSTTMDHVGPICRSVEDAAVLYDVLRGAVSPEPLASADVRGLRLGIPRDYFLAVLDPDVAAVFGQACARLQDAGATIADVTIRHAGDIAPIYLHIVLAEAAAYHAATLDARPDDYSPPVRLRLEMGRYVLAEDYVRARHGRDVLRAEVDSALAGLDGLFLPTLAIPAPKIGAATVRIAGTEETVRNVMLRLTQLFNLTGHPAITLPCGQTAEGLPVGAQLVGGFGRTPDLLRAARAVEPHLRPAGAC